jgi:hypothetical protein
MRRQCRLHEIEVAYVEHKNSPPRRRVVRIRILTHINKGRIYPYSSKRQGK